MSLSLQAVSGIGAQTAEKLAEHGFNSARDLAEALPEQVAAVPGFGASRAARVIEAAQQLLAQNDEPFVSSEEVESFAQNRAEASAPAAMLNEQRVVDGGELLQSTGRVAVGAGEVASGATSTKVVDPRRVEKKRKKQGNRLQRKARQKQAQKRRQKKGKKH